MPKGPRPLDLRVLHRGKREDDFQATGDPQDPAWLKTELQRWLKGNKWHESRWVEFEIEARPAGEWVRPVARVRA